MLFDSLPYIILFLPLTILVYYFLNRKNQYSAAKIWLVLASLLFCGWLNPSFVIVLLVSLFFNFFVGKLITLNLNLNKKHVLIFGIAANVLFLAYYKYMDFFISTLNDFFKTDLTLMHIILPLGISFFTFQQISYLVDSYKGEIKNFDFLDYALFVTFFPKLAAGPITRFNEIVPQFSSYINKNVNWENLSKGLLLFSIGLFKKVIIAGTLGNWASIGFDSQNPLSLIESWISVLSYTFQIYYDFSGYTDMALGAGLMFNIKIPPNFNNPYFAQNIQDFWRRWHITLSRFLKDYIYIPLRGSRKGEMRTYINIFIVFFVCGIWHGASWMFVIWGCLHGAASIINRIWRKTNIQMPLSLNWLITFLFIIYSWIFFRAENLQSAFNMIKSTLGLNGFSVPKIYTLDINFYPDISMVSGWETISFIILPLLIIVIFIGFFHQIPDKFKPNTAYSALIAFLLLVSILNILIPHNVSPFIYFNF